MSRKAKKQDVIDVVVDRKKWGRGNGALVASMLHDPQTGLKCCLGFACVASGISTRAISRKEYPMDLRNPPAWSSSQAEINLAEINDSAFLSDAQREAKIQELGLKIGLDFTFIN